MRALGSEYLRSCLYTYFNFHFFQDTKGTRKIARFSKSKYKDKDNNAKIDEKAFYANSVMGPLLSSKFVRPVTVGIMDEEDFETVRMEAQPFRPLARCKKNIRSRKVIISPDCVFLDDKHRINTFGDTLSIEVKPKLGYHGGECIILGYH